MKTPQHVPKDHKEGKAEEQKYTYTELKVVVDRSTTVAEFVALVRAKQGYADDLPLQIFVNDKEVLGLSRFVCHVFIAAFIFFRLLPKRKKRNFDSSMGWQVPTLAAVAHPTVSSFPSPTNKLSNSFGLSVSCLFR
jgi:hypothetical protein